MKQPVVARSVLFAAVAVVALAEAARAQEAQPKPGTLAGAWREALDLARTHKAPILAFVLPPAGAKLDAERAKATRKRELEVGMLTGKAVEVELPIGSPAQLLLRQVQMLRGVGARWGREPAAPDELQVAFALTVPVVADPVSCRAREGETVVLLDADGKRIEGFALDLLDHDAVRRRLAAAVLAPERLAPRRATVAPGLQRLVDRYLEIAGAPVEDEAEAAQRQEEIATIVERLRQALPGAAPALYGAGSGDGEAASPERQLLAMLESQRAPLGTTADLRAIDPCPPCGMAVVPQQLTTVLKLIGP